MCGRNVCRIIKKIGSWLLYNENAVLQQNQNVPGAYSGQPIYSILQEYSQLLLCRIRLSRITAYLEEKIWPLFKHRNLKSGYKILWKRGEIVPGEQFLPFSTIFSICVSKGVKLHNFICEIWLFELFFFLHTTNLIYRITDISKCFRGPLRFRANESRLYIG